MFFSLENGGTVILYELKENEHCLVLYNIRYHCKIAAVIFTGGYDGGTVIHRRPALIKEGKLSSSTKPAAHISSRWK